MLQTSTFLLLPTEIRLSIYTHCTALTLLQLAHSSSRLKAEIESVPKIVSDSRGFLVRPHPWPRWNTRGTSVRQEPEPAMLFTIKDIREAYGLECELVSRLYPLEVQIRIWYRHEDCRAVHMHKCWHSRSEDETKEMLDSKRNGKSTRARLKVRRMLSSGSEEAVGKKGMRQFLNPIWLPLCAFFIPVEAKRMERLKEQERRTIGRPAYTMTA
jgi:hypothetical protein